MKFKIVLAGLLFAGALPLFSQSAPTATQGELPLTVGFGMSSWDVDWAHGRMQGITAWADWNFYQAPSVLRGLGIEAEGRDINWGRVHQPSNYRQDTAEGGPIYTVRKFSRFQPYAKYLLGIGSMDFTIPGHPHYHHDSRELYAPGLGVTFFATKSILVRVDYEYQFWGKLFGGTPNPQGFTLGAAYDFSRRGR